MSALRPEASPRSPGRAPPSGVPLAVVVKGYPRLSETFVAQELAGLEARGLAFEIWSLRAPYDDAVHPIHRRIRARARYLPEYLHHAPLRVLRGLARCLARPAGLARAGAAFLRDLARDRSVNRVRRFGQALVLAAELPEATRFLYVHFLHTPASVARYAGLIRGLGWGVSAHAKDIWTTPEREISIKLAEARFAVTCTRAGAERLRALAPAPERVALAYHGLDLAELPPPAPRARAPAPFRLVSVGRLVAKKGYDDLLAALARLPGDLDWRLVHVGGGDLARAMAGKARRLGLAGRIDWCGKQPREAVVAALDEADLFVLPAKEAPGGDRDGLPNVLMEAAARRVAILATDWAAIPEFVRHDREGWLVPPERPDRLAEAIVALAADPDRRARLAEAASARLGAEFGPEAGLDLIERCLRDALDEADAVPVPAGPLAAMEAP